MCEKLIFKILTLLTHQDIIVHRSFITSHIFSINKSRLLTERRTASIRSEKQFETII